MARPRAEISDIQVEKLAALGLTNTEIADFYGVDKATVGRRFATILDKGRAQLRQKLRRKQLSVAMGGNVAMLIWLGKQYLEQSDRSDVTEHGETTQHVFNHDGALARIAPGSVGDRDASGAGKSRDDGPAVGEDGHGG